MEDILELHITRLDWSLRTFKEATPLSSLQKLKSEIKELEIELQDPNNTEDLKEEIADCLMCLLDIIGRRQIPLGQIFNAAKLKHLKNEKREWVKNADNSYSHVK